MLTSNECTEVLKKWGRERIIFNNKDLNLCIKELCLDASKRLYESSLHYHPIKDEVFIVQKGVILFREIVDNSIVERQLIPGDVVQLPRGKKHQFACGSDKDAVILEISTWHSDNDVVRVNAQDYNATVETQ